MLLIKSEFRDECSGSILNSIDYNQVKIFYFRLAFVIERNSNQMERV